MRNRDGKGGWGGTAPEAESKKEKGKENKKMEKKSYGLADLEARFGEDPEDRIQRDLMRKLGMKRKSEDRSNVKEDDWGALLGLKRKRAIDDNHSDNDDDDARGHTLIICLFITYTHQHTQPH